MPKSLEELKKSILFNWSTLTVEFIKPYIQNFNERLK